MGPDPDGSVTTLSIHGFLIAGGIALGFMLFMFAIFVMAEVADRVTDWAFDKFMDWFLCRYGSGE